MERFHFRFLRRKRRGDDATDGGARFRKTGDLMTDIRNEILRSNDEEEEEDAAAAQMTIDEFVRRLTRANIHISAEDCYQILCELCERLPAAMAGIEPRHRLMKLSRVTCRRLFDTLDNRPAFRILFDKYSIPILHEIDVARLRVFFAREQHIEKSRFACARLIEQILSKRKATNCASLFVDHHDHDHHNHQHHHFYRHNRRQRLSLNDFYRLLSMPDFALFNPDHLIAGVQRMDKPITAYFIATAGHILFPDSAERARLSTLYRINLDRDIDLVIAKYRDLLWNGYRCLQVKLQWNEEKNCFVVPIFEQRLRSSSSNLNSVERQPKVQINLYQFLFQINYYAFTGALRWKRAQNTFPVILQFDCCDRLREQDLRLLNHIIGLTIPDSILYRPPPIAALNGAERLWRSCFDRIGGQFPTLEKLQQKILIFLIESNSPITTTNHFNIGRLLHGNHNFRRSTSIDLLDALQPNDDQYDLSKNAKAEIQYSDLLAIADGSKRQSIASIEQSIAQYGGDRHNEWPQLALRNLISPPMLNDQVDDDEDDTRLTLNLLQVGVQFIPAINAIGGAFFRLNGNCGYVLKPIHVRRGSLYKAAAEDRAIGPRELPSRLNRYSLRVLAAENLRHFASDMRTLVRVRIVGHAADCAEFRTSICAADGLCPFWNEQFRFNVRMPDIAFLRFDLLNQSGGDERNVETIIGYHVIALKAILRGNRFVPLRDVSGNAVIPQAKLFVNIDYSEICIGWYPIERKMDMKTEEETKSEFSQPEIGHEEREEKCQDLQDLQKLIK